MAQTEPPETLECVERLTLPTYAPIAQSARVEMDDVEASVRLSAAATVQEVAITGPGRADFVKLLAPPIEASVRRARFKPACAGRTVHLRFDFRLNSPADEYPNASFRYPKHFEITGRAPAVNVRQTVP
jgi:hypothetical protein